VAISLGFAQRVATTSDDDRYLAVIGVVER
jgi:hypothetical protein